jgi:hypothetical protein
MNMGMPGFNVKICICLLGTQRHTSVHTGTDLSLCNTRTTRDAHILPQCAVVLSLAQCL